MPFQTHPNTYESKSHLMDDTLEIVPIGQEETSLRVLKNHQSGDIIELKDNVIMAAPVSEDEIVAIEAAIIDLNDIENKIKTRYMSQSIALEMQRYCPDIINDQRPIGFYTRTPSRTGMTVALEEVSEAKSTIFQKAKALATKIWEWFCEKITALYNKVRDRVQNIVTNVKAMRAHAKDRLTTQINVYKLYLIKSTEKSDNPDKKKVIATLKNIQVATFLEEKINPFFTKILEEKKFALNYPEYVQAFQKCSDDIYVAAKKFANGDTDVNPDSIEAHYQKLNSIFTKSKDGEIKSRDVLIVVSSIISNTSGYLIIANGIKDISENTDKRKVPDVSDSDQVSNLNKVVQSLLNILRMNADFIGVITDVQSIYNELLTGKAEEMFEKYVYEKIQAS